MPAFDFADLFLPNLVIALAALLQAATGIGFGMVAVPLLALIDIFWVPGPMLQVNILLSLAIAVSDRRALVPAEIPPILLGLAAGTLLGTAVLVALPSDRLGLLIGLMIVAAVASSLFAPAVRLTRGRILGAATGGGMTGVIAAMHGPPLILLYQRETPAKVRATMGVVFVTGCIMALSALGMAGRYGWAEAVGGLLLIPGLVAGYAGGRWMAGRLTPQLARSLVLAISGIAGLMLVAKSV